MRTTKSTSLLQRTMPMPPPSTVIGADSDPRTCSRNDSCSISNVKFSCPDVRACAAAMSRQIAG